MCRSKSPTYTNEQAMVSMSRTQFLVSSSSPNLRHLKDDRFVATVPVQAAVHPFWPFFRFKSQFIGRPVLSTTSYCNSQLNPSVRSTFHNYGIAANHPMPENAKYDVFISFRGTDIRPGFLSHLTGAFVQKKIHAFVDEKLEKGDDIWPSISKAIEESFISLIIFSKGYASSRWCLQELVKILECREKYRQTVIPVFYDIFPTDVRHRNGGYGTAIAQHGEKYNLSLVQNWRDALDKSANISGIVSSEFRNESELLQKIIQVVNDELMRLSKYSVDFKGLIGIGRHIAHLKTLLHEESKQVRVIGIWGMGGIGKTTIAEEVFDKLCSEYEGSCFLANVKDEYKNHRIISLRQTLFSTLLAEDVKINSPNGLSSNIVRRIGHQKVLVVLDDVNDSNLLKRIFGSLDWLRSDSRIILTARDRQVLIANKVDDIYHVGEMSSTEALQLFKFNAFSQNHVDPEYLKLSERVVNYAKGIPLVLKVLGHLLHGKDKEVWKSQLDKLEKMPNKEVQDIMKLSYDDLDYKEQKLFLDLACFFCEQYVKLDWIKHLLKDGESDNSVIVGLERLKDKALITISKDKISMHDIIIEMGREIVRQESIEDPKSRSRLWDEDDIYKVLQSNQGSEAIQSISIYFSLHSRHIKLSPHIFANMSKLRFLAFDYHMLDLPQGLEYFPSELRYLIWKYYPLKSLPENFFAENLVILDLSHSKVERLWHGVQNLVNLKSVNLKSCKLLKELPDFSKATNLEVLDAGFCEKLTNVHPSIFSLNKLKALHLTQCRSLPRLVSSIHLSSLSYLDLGYCEELTEFSVTSENMIELHLEYTQINALPSSFGRQSKLEWLSLAGCYIESLPSSIKSLTRLRYLNISWCQDLRIIPELPSSIETLLAESCELLETVSFPSTAIKGMRSVEFWHCLKLDEDSLVAIGVNAQVSVINFACRHLSALEHNCAGNNDDYGYNYDSYQAKYVYPGSDVPNWFPYKATKNHIVIDLSSTPRSAPLGFIFCFIFNTFENTQSQYSSDFDIRLVFRVTISDCEGRGKSESVEMYMRRPDCIRMGFDHVCILYDRKISCYINSKAKDLTRFKIEVAITYKDPISRLRLRGFGICPISTATFDNFIQ